MTDGQLDKAAAIYATKTFLALLDVIREEPWPEVVNFLAAAYKQGATAALAAQWVSVEDALPEEHEEVMLYDASSIMHYVIGWRRKKGDNESMWHLSNGYVEDKDITHWRPIIPPTPK